MITPQQIQEISFEKAVFGGYDMDSVDDFLEPLTEDYVTLYKENSVLKSKLRILVEKLEEYRRQESAMQSAILNAQKAGEQMVAEAEKKSARILRDAEAAAVSKTENMDARVEEEETRLETAKEATRKFMDGMEKRLKRQLELMDELRKMELAPKAAEKAQEEHTAFDFDKEPDAPTTEEKADALIQEIGQHLEESLAEEQPAEPLTPLIPQEDHLPDDATRRINLQDELPKDRQKKFEDLKFGKNYHFSDNK